MFNSDDFENIKKVKPDTVPDGVVDASSYHEILKVITLILKESNYDDPDTRMAAMMNVVNLFHDDEETINEDNVYGVTIALMFHIQSIFCGMLQEDRDEYFNYVDSQVMPLFGSESSAIPYYETDFGGSDE